MFFKTALNVPEIYTTESRDFQILESVIDALFNTLLLSVSEITYLRHPFKISNNLLPLIQSYVGYFTDLYYPENILRAIIINFPLLIKLKGTEKAIEEGVKALQSALTNNAKVSLKKSGSKLEDNWSYDLVITNGVPVDSQYIDDLLRYLKPIGLMINNIIYEANEGLEYAKEIKSSSPLYALYAEYGTGENSNYLFGQIRRSPGLPAQTEITDNYTRGEMPERLLSAINHTPIVRSRSFIKAITVGKEGQSED